MAFPRRLLFEGEEVVVELRPHWVFLGWPLLATVGALAAVIAIVSGYSNAPSWVWYPLEVLVAIPALWLVGRVIRWQTTSIVVTTTRILERYGVFSRRSDEIRLEAVNQISYHQTILQRVFRVGNVYIEVPGRTGVIVYRCLSRPDVVQRIISEEVDELYGRGGGPGPGSATSVRPGAPTAWMPETDEPSSATPPTGSPMVSGSPSRPPSVVDAMAQLDELRRRRLLSDAEYEAKRAEVLRRL